MTVFMCERGDIYVSSKTAVRSKTDFRQDDVLSEAGSWPQINHPPIESSKGNQGLKEVVSQETAASVPGDSFAFIRG